MDDFAKPHKTPSRNFSPTYDFSNDGQRSASWGMANYFCSDTMKFNYYRDIYCRCTCCFDASNFVFVAFSGDTFRKCFGLDHRSLALYRVTIGMVILCDMIDRWKDMYVWYTDDGMVSRKVLTGLFWDPVCFYIMSHVKI